MSEPNVLPDSRLKDQNFGTVMMDVVLADGRTVRLEHAPTWCANCGKAGPYFVKDNCSFAFYLCQPCFEAHGAPAGTWVSSDDDFRRKVAAEVEVRFGRSLSAEELLYRAQAGDLGRPLELLARESPWKEWRGDA